MDDVKDVGADEVPQAPAAPQGETTPATETVAQPTTETVAPQAPQERTIPYPRFSEVNQKLREAQKELAAFKAEKESAKYSQNDPDYYARLMADPYVQELILKDAKRDLTDFARDTLADEKYASLNPQVKKAILSNARGFVKESTTDVETAKIDLLEWIESILEEDQASQPQAPKGFPVASTNAPTAEPAGTPAEIAKIMEKSPLEMSDDEVKVLEGYQGTLEKKSKKS